MRAETEDETFTSSMPFEETNPPHTNGASEAELEDGELEDDIKISVPINVTGNENGQVCLLCDLVKKLTKVRYRLGHLIRLPPQRKNLMQAALNLCSRIRAFPTV